MYHLDVSHSDTVSGILREMFIKYDTEKSVRNLRLLIMTKTERNQHKFTPT